MSIPILKVNDSLLVSIQEDLDDQSAMQLQEDILKNIQSTNATGIVMDLSLVNLVDSFIAKILVDIVNMSDLMGARVIVTGVQPLVAITLNEMGISMKNISTAIDVEKGLESLKEYNGRIQKLKT
ncbi:STAS domain-containing protein [Fictibacillus sp. KIGAM418]|uniref:STAS domain-containing protein n=1 Tax=Fictibacillus marinisediminis TaxID=2878389 RepID=A0A9X1XB11_9BACL|nr:STAS domain-containing protein [Fictibacillus marinisediminis]MCK6257268.1 STAS domain-containing protein [Fictibacillus marinisediminis]